MTKMTRQQQFDFYKNNGFTKILGNLSGIGTDVLVNSSTVVRIGGDPGYAHFARLVTSANCNLTHVVKIYSHIEPLGDINDLNDAGEYSITVIEPLTAMSIQESKRYVAWASTALKAIINEEPTTDPFDLVDDIKILIEYAKKNNLTIDLVNSKNIMKRGNDFIILDPFA